MTVYSRDPAYWDTACWDYFRWDVYTSRWERLFQSTGAYRELTRRVRNVSGAPDSTTSQVYPSYDEETIEGILVQRGGSMPEFAVGVVCLQDAVLLTLDTVKPKDQVKDGDVYYEVYGEPVENPNPGPEGGFAFHTVQLHRIDLFIEG